MDSIVLTVFVALMTSFGALAFAIFKAGQLSREVQSLREELDRLRRRVTAQARRSAEESWRSGRVKESDVGAAQPVSTLDPSVQPSREDIEQAAEDARAGETADTGPEGATLEEPPGDATVPSEPTPDDASGSPPDSDDPEREEAASGDAAREEPIGTSSTPSAADLETVLGTTWLLRIGLGVLAIALALFARTVAPQLSPAAKVAAAYAASIGLFAVGKFFEARLERFARPVMAAGLSFGFFVAYAAHFVPAMSAIPLAASVAWMALSMVAVVVAAERWGSEPTAILGIILGHVAAQVSAGRADGYALVMILALGATAVVLLLRHTWVRLGILAVLASYGSHVLWALADRELPSGSEAFWISAAFATSYYVVFLIADVLWWHRIRPRVDHAEAEQARLLGPTNLALYVAVTSFLYVAAGAPVESIEWYFLGLGALQGAVAFIYWGSDNEDSSLYPLFGTVLWTVGMVAAFDGLALNLVLAAQALMLTFAATRTQVRVFGWLSHGMMALTFVHYVVAPWPTPGFGSLLAGVAIAATYLVKALVDDEDEERPDWPTAALSLAAGLVLLREGWTHLLDTPWLGLFWLVAGSLVWLAAWRFKRSAFVVTICTIGVGAIPAVASATDTEAPWASVALPLGLIVWAAATNRWITPARGSHFASTLVLLGSAIASGLVAAALEAPSLSALLWWMTLPASLWAAAAWMWASAVKNVDATSSEGGGGPAARHIGPALISVAASALAVALIVGLQPTLELHPLWIAGAATLLLGLGVRLGNHVLLLGLTALLLIGYGVTLVMIPGESGTWSALAQHPLMEQPAPALFLIGLALAAAGCVERAAGNAPLQLRPFAISLYVLGIVVAGLAGVGIAPAGWHLAVIVMVCLGCAVTAVRFPLPGAAIAAALGVALAHVHFIGVAVANSASWLSSAWVGTFAFILLSLAAERVTAHAGRKAEWSESGVRALVVLVAALTISGLMAVYHSAPLGGAWTTAGWSVLGALLMTIGFVDRVAIYRRSALAVFALCLIRLFVVDTVGLSDTARIGAFAVLGLILVGVALLYTRYTERVKSWL